MLIEKLMTKIRVLKTKLTLLYEEVQDHKIVNCNHSWYSCYDRDMPSGQKAYNECSLCGLKD